MEIKDKVFPVTLWLVIASVLLAFSWQNAPEADAKRLFGDQSVHIMTAMSVWHDFDLEYTLDDLKRFKEVITAELGPRGLFLKSGRNDQLYYAKPFLYGVTAAPFYGAFGMGGFIVLNAICFFVVGVVAASALKPHFGSTTGTVIAFFLMVFSPFVAWLSIPHPDLFIASLLAFGGYLVLSKTESLPLVVGGFLIGLVVFEKPTFAVIVPFFFITLWGLPWKARIVLFLTIFGGWLVPTLVNIIQDGRILAYQGSRFGVSGEPFPLEDGWVMPRHSITAHIFSFASIIKSLVGNFFLIPEKLHDFLIGRQTGILIYFPVAFALLVWIGFVGGNRSRWLLVAFFFYLALNWLVFPTNGYGGSQSYGSRYLLQVLPLLILAFLASDSIERNGSAKKRHWALKSVVFSSLVISVFTQNKVLPPTEYLVSSPGTYLDAYPAKWFPIEKSLLPSIASIMPKSFSERRQGSLDSMYRTGLPHDYSDGIRLKTGLQQAEVVLYQFGNVKSPPPIEIISTVRTKLNLFRGDELLWNGVLEPTKPTILNLEKEFFTSSYFDLLSRRHIRWETLKLVLEVVPEESAYETGWATINFKKTGVSQEFSDFGYFVTPQELDSLGILSGFSWGYLEAWGVWTSGAYADLSFRLAEDTDAIDLTFTLKAYTPPEHPLQSVDVIVNGKVMDDWRFIHGEGYTERTLRLRRQDWGKGGNVRIGFQINNPASPSELGLSSDKRLLGIGLKGLIIEKVK